MYLYLINRFILEEFPERQGYSWILIKGITGTILNERGPYKREELRNHIIQCLVNLKLNERGMNMLIRIIPLLFP
jgi:hypothetical protein